MSRPRWRRHWTTALAIFNVLAALAALVALWRDYYNALEQSYYNAWTSINSATGSTVDGGRKQALLYLKENGQSLQGAPLRDSFLSYAKLDGADLNRSDIRNADLFGADLRAAALWGADMKDANLQFARLQGANLLSADLRCADLRGAHLEPLKVSAYEVMNILRRQPLISGRTNLDKARLQFARLDGADLRGACLRDAKLNHAHLGEYKDRFEADEGKKLGKRKRKSQEDIQCKRTTDGLIDIIAVRPREPSAAEICRWALCHPTEDDHVELPEGFDCHNYKSLGYIHLSGMFCPDCTGSALCSTQVRRWKDLPKALVNVLEIASSPSSDLTGADLTGADLTGAYVTIEQVKAAARLCHTTLPAYMPAKLGDRDCDRDSRSVKISEEEDCGPLRE